MKIVPLTPIANSGDQLKEADEIIEDCVHYGFCVSVCPTYVVTGNELESPRGRIGLIEDMLRSKSEPSRETVEHIDQCLSCQSCMSTCAASVDYAHLVDTAREHIEKHYKRRFRERLQRSFIASVIPHAGRMNLALYAGRLAKPFAKMLPGQMREMINLVPASAPKKSEFSDARVLPAEGALRMRVALVLGCAQQVLGASINDAAIRLLRRHGCEVVIPQFECCGALTLHMGRKKQAQRSASSAIDAMVEIDSTMGLDAIVVTASGCGTTMKDYGHLFSDGASEQDVRVAGRIACLVRDITEVLEQLGIQPDADKHGLRVAYHDACSLQHGQRIKGAPRNLLRSAGFHVHDVPEGHFCCGSAGTYNMLQPEMAKTLGQRKAHNIASTGAQVAAAGNLGCIEQLERFLGLPIVHTVELLDWATGGPAPDRLREVIASSRDDNATSQTNQAEAELW